MVRLWPQHWHTVGSECDAILFLTDVMNRRDLCRGIHEPSSLRWTPVQSMGSIVFVHPVVVLDFETTGLNAGEDRVTEVAAIRIESGRITHRFETLVNCERRISRSIAMYTHITQAMIDLAPRTVEVFHALIPFLGNDPVFAHNAEFDQRFFQAECERAGVTLKLAPFHCSLKLAEQVFPGLPSYALSPLARSLGLKVTQDAHRAGPDAELTAELLIKLTAELCGRHAKPFLHISMLDDLMQRQVSAAA